MRWIYMIGEALGNYRLVAKLGSGSMGVVFLAQHQRIARQVAIKLLDPDLVRNQHVLQRFFNEALAASLIRHPGIVDVFDCDVDANGRAYMVMEHLEGETLADRLRQTGRLHWIAASLIAGQVADALGAVHAQKIVHRDLKPENVFLVGDPRAPAAAVKVLDFGVVKLMASDPAARLTVRGTLVGTPEYMSPEQCAAAEAIDHRADIYALGCILFEMLSGKPPFVAPTLRELMTAHRFHPAPSLAASCPEAPGWLRDLLARMLAKEPGERPSSMQEVSKVLRRRKVPGPMAPATGPRAVLKRAAQSDAPRDIAQRKPHRLAAMIRRLEARRTEIAIVLIALCVLTGAAWAMRRNSGFEHRSQESAGQRNIVDR